MRKNIHLDISLMAFAVARAALFKMEIKTIDNNPAGVALDDVQIPVETIVSDVMRIAMMDLKNERP